MIKLKKILFERPDEIIKFSEKNISKIVKYLKNAYVFQNQLLYRRISGYNEVDAEIRDIRKDRNLRDTDEFAYEVGKAALSFYGKSVPDRRESLYAYSTADIDTAYGDTLTVVFPEKTCEIFYNKNVKDSYMAYNIKFLYSSVNSEYLIFTRKHKLVHLSRFLSAYQNYKKLGYIDDSSFDVIQKKILLINFDKIKNEISIAKDIIYKMEKQIEIGKLKYEDNTVLLLEFRMLLDGIREFINNITEYESGMEILKNKQKLPPGEFEVIIIGDEYLIADSEPFKNTFIWSNKLKTWVPKKGRV